MNRARTPARGFTLLELTIAVSTSGVIVVGIVSSIYLALRAADKSTTPAAATLEGTRVLTELALDLTDSVSLVTQAPTGIATYVPDRDNDGNAELSQYIWSGLPGYPLYRICDGGLPKIVADDVHEFLIEYIVSPNGGTYINVAIQISEQSAARVETAIPLNNI